MSISAAMLLAVCWSAAVALAELGWLRYRHHLAASAMRERYRYSEIVTGELLVQARRQLTELRAELAMASQDAAPIFVAPAETPDPERGKPALDATIAQQPDAGMFCSPFLLHAFADTEPVHRYQPALRAHASEGIVRAGVGRSA